LAETDEIVAILTKSVKTMQSKGLESPFRADGTGKS